MQQPVHVIGAGISGLGAAHYLARLGIPAVIHEASEHIGGRAAGIKHGDRWIELGGKNYSTAWAQFNALLHEFDLQEFEPQHPSFHLVMDDCLVKLDKARTLSGDLRLMRILGLRGALQFKAFLDEAKHHADRLNYSGGLIEEVERRFDWAPASRHFARSLTEGPFRLFSIIAGAAEPSEVYPSLLMLFASAFGKGEHRAIKGGIGRLHDHLAADKTICFGSRVERIAIEGDRVVGIETIGRGGRRYQPCRQVISTLPCHAMRGLVPLPAYGRVAADRIRYFPLAMINAGYDGPVFRDDVHSIMFEPGSPLGHCSANRLDQPHHVRYTLSGAAARDILDRPDQELIQAAEQAFSERLPIRARRTGYHVARHVDGVCAYGASFTSAKRDLLRAIEGINGLEIAGDYLEGHTMEGCLQAAKTAVTRLFDNQAQCRPEPAEFAA